MEAVVLQQTTTGAAVRLELPEFLNDDQVLGSLKRRHGDRAIAQGKLRGDGTIMVVSAYGEMQPSATWRDALMKGKLAGVGQFAVGPTACTESTRELEPPFVNVSWHTFPSFADTCFDISMGTLSKDGVAPISRADFENIVKSARYAIVRLGTWNDMPAAVLEPMHTALARTENDGGAFLAEKSKAAPDDWGTALAAAEIGVRTKMPAAERQALYARAVAALAKLEQPGKPEQFAFMTAQSGLAIAMRDQQKYDDALATLATAALSPGAKTKLATAALEYDAATIHALKLDGAATVEHLKLSLAADSDRKVYATRDPSFQGVASNQELFKLLKPTK
jgi:hypothetical protein